MARVVSSRQTWQVIGILSLLIALASVGGMIHIGSQSKFIPYVVEVDKLGPDRGRRARCKRRRAADPRVVHASVAEFVTDARLVTPDVALQRKAVFRVYVDAGPERSGHGQDERMAERQPRTPARSSVPKGNGQHRDQVGACRKRRTPGKSTGWRPPATAKGY